MDRLTNKPPKVSAAHVTIPDVQRRFKAHVAAAASCAQYLEQTIAFRKAGKLNQAKARRGTTLKRLRYGNP
jgi:hypothetical protein